MLLVLRAHFAITLITLILQQRSSRWPSILQGGRHLVPWGHCIWETRLPFPRDWAAAWIPSPFPMAKSCFHLWDFAGFALILNGWLAVLQKIFIKRALLAEELEEKGQENWGALSAAVSRAARAAGEEGALRGPRQQTCAPGLLTHHPISSLGSQPTGSVRHWICTSEPWGHTGMLREGWHLPWVCQCLQRLRGKGKRNHRVQGSSLSLLLVYNRDSCKTRAVKLQEDGGWGGRQSAPISGADDF